MVEAKEDVNKMKAELAIKNQELAAASKEAEALLKSISESTAVAEKGKQRSCIHGLCQCCRIGYSVCFGEPMTTSSAACKHMLNAIQ